MMVLFTLILLADPPAPTFVVDAGNDYIRLEITPPHPPHARLTGIEAECQMIGQTALSSTTAILEEPAPNIFPVDFRSSVQASRIYQCKVRKYVLLQVF